MDNEKINYQILGSAFRGAPEARKAFLHALSNFEKGRHVLDLYPSFIYDLKNGQNARRRSLNLIFFPKTGNLNFVSMKSRDILYLSEITYDILEKGLNAILKNLDLTAHVSVEKIIKAGSAIKNHNADDTYGGRTVRDYLNFVMKDKGNVSSITPDELLICKKAIKQKEADIVYTNIKSLPFSFLGYQEKVTSCNGKIVTPDIEAKCNLKKILGAEKYLECFANKLSISDATICEDLLIRKMQFVMQKEISSLYDTKINDIPEILRNKISKSTNISSISAVTSSGQIKDIVENIGINIDTVIKLSKEPDAIIDTESLNNLFRIEYISMQEDIDFPSDYSTWLMEFGAAKSGRYAIYRILSEIMVNRCSPCIDGSPLTDYKFNNTQFVANSIKAYATALTKEEKDQILENIKSYIKED